MLYNKPKDLKYTDMAIYIDQFLDQKYVPNEDKIKIFEYLYHLVHMLARKGKFFNKNQYYDDFSITVASDVYMRLFSDKRFEYNADGSPKLEPIKSCLNYLKSIIKFRKIDFEQTAYAQTLSQEDETVCAQYNFMDMIDESALDLHQVEFQCSINTINDGIRQYLKRIPYKQDSSDWYNIYMSCLLTFISFITPPSYQIRKFQTGQKNSIDAYVEVVKQESQSTNAVLYHLPDHMNDYIVVLVREIRHFIADSLSQETHYNVSSSDLQYIALQSINSSMYDSEQQGYYSNRGDYE